MGHSSIAMTGIYGSYVEQQKHAASIDEFEFLD
jgi:hypothetical protein